MVQSLGLGRLLACDPYLATAPPGLNVELVTMDDLLRDVSCRCWAAIEPSRLSEGGSRKAEVDHWGHLVQTIDYVIHSETRNITLLSIAAAKA